jgi:hypothetical protein
MIVASGVGVAVGNSVSVAVNAIVGIWLVTGLQAISTQIKQAALTIKLRFLC